MIPGPELGEMAGMAPVPGVSPGVVPGPGAPGTTMAGVEEDDGPPAELCVGFCAAGGAEGVCAAHGRARALTPPSIPMAMAVAKLRFMNFPSRPRHPPIGPGTIDSSTTRRQGQQLRAVNWRWHGLLVLAQILIPCLVLADFSGRNVTVIDGNTIRVLSGKRIVTVRLHGIDCPAKKQPYGKQAKKALRKLIFGKVVTIQGKTPARKSPLVAVVLTQDGREVNRELVQAGWCWADEDHSTDYIKEMQEAREAKRGLWQDPNPIRPEDWRIAQQRKLRPQDFPLRPQVDGEPPMEF